MTEHNLPPIPASLPHSRSAAGDQVHTGIIPFACGQTCKPRARMHPFGIGGPPARHRAHEKHPTPPTPPPHPPHPQRPTPPPSVRSAGLVLFVLTLQQGQYTYQFRQLAWTHLIVFFVVLPTSFLVPLAFEGLVWFFLPCGLVIVNDIMAYLAGTSTPPRPAASMHVPVASMHVPVARPLRHCWSGTAVVRPVEPVHEQSHPFPHFRRR